MNELNITNEEPQQRPFSGVWPALLTPMNAEGSPDLNELEKITELANSEKLDGIYLLGSTGQGFLLTEDQRKKVTEVVTSVNSGRLPIIVQVGSMTTSESVRLARHAAQNGADGISSVGPIYYSSAGGPAEMALLHYREIATATDLPFFPYQFGEHGNVGGIPAFIDRLLTIPNVEGMKLTTNNLLEISTYAYSSKGRLTLFSGSDELMCQAALCGTVGAIGSTYNLWGKECQKVRAAFLEGDVQLGADFMLVFQEVIGSILPSFWSFVRQAMLLRYNIDVGMPIAPLGNTNVVWAENQVIDLVERVINAADLKILQEYE